jgi:CDP-diacylglycerol--glycerol-3-phosphate 3-phosphatidyltransferase
MVEQIPNILTFARLALTIIFLIMILYSPFVANKPSFLDITFVVFLAAALTDIIDGPIARKLNVASKFGRMLDPLADKVLVCGAFICFAIIGEPKLFDLDSITLTLIHWFVVGVLVLREAYVTALRHIAEARGVNFAATFSGKIKMFIQSFAIGTVIVKIAYVPTSTWGYWFTTITLAAMLTVTVISGLTATRRRSWKAVT